MIPWLGGAESDEGIEFSDAQKAFILKRGAVGMPVRRLFAMRALDFAANNKFGSMVLTKSLS